MADTVKLTAPNGTHVEVEAGRAEVLKSRGYLAGHVKVAASSAPKERTVATKAGSNDTVTVNSETGRRGKSSK